MGLTFIAFAEIMAVAYVYGHERFTQDIFEMTGTRPGVYWQVMWRFAAPSLIAAILVCSVVSQFLKVPTYSAWNQEEASQTNPQKLTVQQLSF